MEELTARERELMAFIWGQCDHRVKTEAGVRLWKGDCLTTLNRLAEGVGLNRGDVWRRLGRLSGLGLFRMETVKARLGRRGSGRAIKIRLTDEGFRVCLIVKEATHSATHSATKSEAKTQADNGLGGTFNVSERVNETFFNGKKGVNDCENLPRARRSHSLTLLHTMGNNYNLEQDYTTTPIEKEIYKEKELPPKTVGLGFNSLVGARDTDFPEKKSDEKKKYDDAEKKEAGERGKTAQDDENAAAAIPKTDPMAQNSPKRDFMGSNSGLSPKVDKLHVPDRENASTGNVANFPQADAKDAHPTQIGRASCRERV